MEIEIGEPERPPFRPSFELAKLFEDEWLLIIDKPAGISVHPGAGPRQETILDVFRYLYPQVEQMREKERPGLVHRLDKDTSGILLLAKDEQSMVRLQKQFKKRRIQKTYLALVSGRMRFRHGLIDLPISRSQRQRTRFQALRQGEERPDAREALTEYDVIREFPGFSLVRLLPRTGRTHQLRVHLAATGNPVLGDQLYGGRRQKEFPRLALHAYSLSFVHPHTGQTVCAFSPLPAELRLFLAESLRKSKKLPGKS